MRSPKVYPGRRGDLSGTPIAPLYVRRPRPVVCESVYLPRLEVVRLARKKSKRHLPPARVELAAFRTHEHQPDALSR